MAFKVGDTVVYPHHGAARVEAIETRTIKGEDRTYLVLRVDKGDLTVHVPAENAEEVGVRDVVGKEGLEKVFEATTTDVTVSHRGERFASSPWPLEGGAPGARAHAFILRKDGTREELPSKKMLVLHPGDQLWEYIAGGAGYGDPLERDPAAVLADVLDGKIASPAGYGVVLTPDGRAVDEVKTKGRREAQAAPAQRLRSSLP